MCPRLHVSPTPSQSRRLLASVVVAALLAVSPLSNTVGAPAHAHGSPGCAIAGGEWEQDPCRTYKAMTITGTAIVVVAAAVALAPVPGARLGAGLAALIGGGLALAGMVGSYISDC